MNYFIKQDYKNKEIYLRLIEEEHITLKEKAKNYPTFSSFVLDACKNFDDELGIKRLDVIRKWCSDYEKYENELNQIGAVKFFQHEFSEKCI